MKIAIISNNTSDIIKSRGELIKAIINKGHEVLAIGNEDVDAKKFEELGIKFKSIPIDRITVNIFKNIRYIVNLSKLLKKEKVDIILGYTIKPIVCGAIAGKIAKTKRIYALVTGIGYNYSINTFRTKVIRFFCNFGYRKACKICTKFIFQNKEDQEEFIQKRYIKRDKTELVDGSGVNMNIFKKTENRIESAKKLRFLMISRGINVKGIKELAKAAKQIHVKYPDVKFIHIGKLDYTYRGIPKSEIDEYSKYIEFNGKVKNVYEYIANSNVAILPSYLMEGIPRVLLEALAVGRPIITTDIRGCKETVIENENGYLVKPRDEKDLEDKILKMINNSNEKILQMSEKSYELAKKRFDVNIINKKMLDIMQIN